MHRIDVDGRITYLDEGWCRFAAENGAPELPGLALGRPLWSFITGLEVDYVNRALVAAARQQERPIVIPYRCDSPTLRRFMEMSLVPVGSELEIRSRILREEPYAGAILFRTNEAESDWLQACSWCRRIVVGSRWLEIEDAVRELDLLGGGPLPVISHGICKQCREKILQTAG